MVNKYVFWVIIAIFAMTMIALSFDSYMNHLYPTKQQCAKINE